MKPRFGLYSIVLHLALVGLCFVTVQLAFENRQLKERLAPAPNGPSVGESVAAIHLQSLDGEETVHDPTASGRDSLLFVFTTDCPACRQTQDDWRTLHQELDGGVDVLGISLSAMDSTRGYRDQLDLSFPVGIPTEPERLTQNLSISGVPLTLRVGPDGRVRGSWSGTLSADQLTEVARADQG